MKVLITGASGFLGQHLARALSEHHDVLVCRKQTPVLTSHARECVMDITDASSVEKVFNGFVPEVVVHLAAMSVVAQCEKYPGTAFNVNVLGTRNLVHECSKLNAHFFHFSTDMVFDGEKNGRYVEEDAPNPLTVYALTKLKAEIEASCCPRNAIFRMALMYGKPEGSLNSGFLYWIKKEAEAGRKVNLFSDQYRSPVYVGDVCMATEKAIKTGLCGLFNVGGPDTLSRVDVGKVFLPLAGFSVSSINPQFIKDAVMPYALQKNLCLNSSKIEKELQISFTPFREGALFCV